MTRIAPLLALLLAAAPPPVVPELGSQAAGATISASDALDATARRVVVGRLAAEMRDRYVFPDIGARVAATLDAALAAGAYDGLVDPAMLARRLTADADAVAHDKHLRVRPTGGTGGTGADTEPRRAPPPRSEAGVVRADRLSGGIGYVEVIGFPPAAFFKRPIDAAMTALKGSRALIVDVRRNGGGEPESVAYLVSFLVARDRPINDIVSRTAGTGSFTRERYRSVATPVAFTDVPVYVLTGKDTFSGGEEFAYDVQALRRGTLVGEVTGGGANPTETVALGHGMEASIPTGRAENPVTHTNWEGTGVRPDLPVAAADALGAALSRAGQPAVAEIAAASRRQVFGDRRTPLAGSEAALRRLIAGFAGGTIDAAIAAPGYADTVRGQLPRLRSDVAPLGRLRSVRFLRPDQLGGDEYRLDFVGGKRTMALVVGADGRILAATSLKPVEQPSSRPGPPPAPPG